jgi:ABC-type multidrug transport system ATPase subunit
MDLIGDRVSPAEAETERLTVEGVGKVYSRGRRALQDVSLDLVPGVVGLLGPNGAGKSTLLRILATITRPTEGRVTFRGDDVVRRPEPLRRVLGYLPQDFGVYPNLNAIEFLEYLAAVKEVPRAVARTRIPELLALVNLTEAARRPLGSYSGGMRQRVGIAQALLNDPRVLIVDEPTVGLDPEERVRFRGALADLAGDRLVLFSTHIVSDIESVADRIALLDRGRLVAFETPEALLRRAEGRVWEWVVRSEALPSLRERCAVSGTVRRADGVHVRAVADSAPDPSARGVEPTLEDAYLARTRERP